MLVSIAGLCLAAESPAYITYIQGSESIISEGSDGMINISVNNVIPYFSIDTGEKSSLIPVRRLSSLTYPLIGAVVFSDPENESTSMVKVSNLSLSEGNKVLTLEVIPLKYYDGGKLQSLADKQTELATGKIEECKKTQIFFETNVPLASNNLDEDCNCPKGYYITYFGGDETYCCKDPWKGSDPGNCVHCR
jgi:hypothetical protein